MKSTFTQFRIAIGLTGLAVCAVFAALNFGFIQNDTAARLNGRKQFCKSLAVTLPVIIQQSDTTTIKSTLEETAANHPELLSICLRKKDGSLVASTSGHTATATRLNSVQSTDTDVQMPIVIRGEPWGSIEIRFKPLHITTTLGWMNSSFIFLLATVVLICLTTFFAYLHYAFKTYDPSRAVPMRVRDALNALAGGLMIVNTNGEIILSNSALASKMGISPDQLSGKLASNLPWIPIEVPCGETGWGKPELPWEVVSREGQAINGVIMKLLPAGMNERTFIVNSVPLRDDNQKCQGVLISLEDVTPLENKKAELSKALTNLRDFNDKISLQNRELERLAMRDALTGCINRRAFFEQFSVHWTNSLRYKNPLSAIMVDVDHFKSVNDRFGHSMGDEVLQKVAATLMETARQGDIVCRYGGEEFAVLLTHTDLANAISAGERIRIAISKLAFPDISVTTSIGVSALSLGAKSMQELLDQADKSLFVAKRNGRNRTVSWDMVPADTDADPKSLTRVAELANSTQAATIPYPAVTALISTLTYRDVKTAEHSRRVADYCVMVAEELMSTSECYVLEIGALLHDIGKIGVPDEILLKPDLLTNEERQIIEKHDRIGNEIIRVSFNSTELSEIIENRHAAFCGGASPDEQPAGINIPLGARILSIADAYDAMITDLVYRKGRCHQEAFEELRRCAGLQFDPELVERFISVVSLKLSQNRTDQNLVNKNAALNFGLQMERIAAAVDHQDLKGLKVLASRLDEIATMYSANEIASKARQLHQIVDNADLIDILKTANELQNACRETQMSYLQASSV